MMRSCGIRTWPISGCSIPCRTRPCTIAPPPMPVPTVRYKDSVSPCAAPQRVSPRAAALTSVSKPTGTPRARRTAPAKSRFSQPGLGVVVTYPKVFESGCRSTGPKDPMPTAWSRLPACSRNQLTALSMVASGEVVGNWVVRRSSGPVPMPQTNLVPPASMPPKTFMWVLVFEVLHKLWGRRKEFLRELPNSFEERLNRFVGQTNSLGVENLKIRTNLVCTAQTNVIELPHG